MPHPMMNPATIRAGSRAGSTARHTSIAAVAAPGQGELEPGHSPPRRQRRSSLVVNARASRSLAEPLVVARTGALSDSAKVSLLSFSFARTSLGGAGGELQRVMGRPPRTFPASRGPLRRSGPHHTDSTPSNRAPGHRQARYVWL